MFLIQDKEKEMRYRATVFQVQKEDKYVDANLSTYEKVKDETGETKFKNSAWSARFIGKNIAKAKELSDQDKIALTNFKIENVYVSKTGQNYLRILVYDFVSASELKEFDAARNAVKNADPNA